MSDALLLDRLLGSKMLSWVPGSYGKLEILSSYKLGLSGPAPVLKTDATIAVSSDIVGTGWCQGSESGYESQTPISPMNSYSSASPED